jgi:hypothetical protein
MRAYYLKLFSLVCLLLLINGCVDLSGARNTYINKHSLSTQTSLYAGEVHTMLGGLGIFSTGMNQLRNSAQERYKIRAYSTMWYNAGDVSQFIIKNYYQQKNPRPIILIGHSLGANEQIKVARNLNKAGVPVALLVTVDAVSQTIVPPNVKEVLNLYKPGFVPMFSGLKLRAVDPVKTKIDNINAAALDGVHVNHFTIDKEPVFQELILKRIKQVLIYGKRKGA